MAKPEEDLVVDVERRTQWAALARLGLHADDDLTVQLAVALACTLELLEQASADANLVEVELDTEAVERARRLNQAKTAVEADRGHQALRLLDDDVWECDACTQRGDLVNGPTPEQLPCAKDEPADAVPLEPVTQVVAEAATRRAGPPASDRQLVVELGRMLLEARERSEQLRGTLGYLANYAAGEAALYEREALGTPARAWRFIASTAGRAAGHGSLGLEAADQLRELARGDMLERAVAPLRELSQRATGGHEGSAEDYDWRPVVGLLEEYDRHGASLP